MSNSTTVAKSRMPVPTPLTVEQEQLVLSSQTIVRQMAWNMARDSRAYLEVGDLMSAGMEAICDAVRRLPADCRNPEGYLCKVAQYTMIHVRKQENVATILSLDVPLTSQDCEELLYADQLVDHSFDPAPPIDEERASLVREALTRLSPCERACMLHRFGFGDYAPRTPAQMARDLGISYESADSAYVKARRKLLKDPVLCEAMGVAPGELLEQSRKAEVSKKDKPRRQARDCDYEHYAREIGAYHAGHTSFGQMAKVLGITRQAARMRLNRMRALGMVPEYKAPEEQPVEVKYARELEAWHAGNTSRVKLAKALGLSKGVAWSRVVALREAGLIQTKPAYNSAYLQSRGQAVR